jgi:hypothetical protein
LVNSLRRYQRRVSLWLLLIAAPIAARYMIPMGPDAEGVRIIIGRKPHPHGDLPQGVLRLSWELQQRKPNWVQDDGTSLWVGANAMPTN